MARTPTVTRDQVPEQFRAAFDAETAASGGVVASGPGSVMINSPEMRQRANRLADYLRNESSLPKKLQESGFGFDHPQVEEALQDVLKNER